MRLIITEEHVGDWSAYFIAKRILDFAPTEDKPFVLGIPGGGTVLPMYERLVQFHQDGVLSFKNVVFFNTGEYLGIDPTNVNSFSSTINTNFFNFVDAQVKNIHLLNALAEDIKEEALRYEELIKSYGGVNLWVCGLGDDGHLAFNEPGSSLQSRTRDKELAFETRVANAKFFNGNLDLVPKVALTIGVGTLLDAEEIIVLAQGANKSRALQVSIEEGINHLYPASALQMHTKATFVASEDAVADIRLRTYRYHKEVESKSIHPKILIKGLYKSYYALVNARVFDGEKFLDNATVIIENDRIKSIEMDASSDIVMSKIDLKGKTIVPGYIDLQVNGCGGADINYDISIDALQVMFETNLKHGVTSYAPTFITNSDEKILEAINLINHIENKNILGIIAWHFEGPYLSKMKKGIHAIEHIRKPSQEMLDAIINAKIDRKILTLAPEENTAEDIKKLADGGVIVSMGHTNGTHNQLKEKIPHGITMATHLYNAMSPMDSREPGAVGTVLENDNIYAGIIVDGIHSNYASVDVAYKSLGDHLFLVSDAAAPAGTDIEEFEFGGRKIYHRDGKCVAEDGTLAGVAILMDKCVQNLVKYVKVPLEDAFRMASLYPARSIKKDDEYGYIKAGYKANITILDDDLNVHGVVFNGRYIPVEEKINK